MVVRTTVMAVMDDSGAATMVVRTAVMAVMDDSGATMVPLLIGSGVRNAGLLLILQGTLTLRTNSLATYLQHLQVALVANLLDLLLERTRQSRLLGGGTHLCAASTGVGHHAPCEQSGEQLQQRTRHGCCCAHATNHFESCRSIEAAS